MKIPFTDQFLLNLYDLIEEIDRTSEKFFPPRTMQEFLYNDFYKLRKEYERKKDKKYFFQFINYLKKKDYIEIKNLKNKEGILLTKKGTEKVLNLKLKTEKRKRRSDKKYQMIIFDIPEKKKYLRDLLRKKLLQLEYRLFQRSVWVCPYDVLKETEKFLREHSLDPYVRIFLIEEI
ncbi:MAG: hypothetical protein ABH808_02080 [Candidatus Kuenenbacteria bacterium]